MKIHEFFDDYKGILKFAFILFLVEFVRGAILITYLPAYAIQHLGMDVAAVGIAVTIHYIADTGIKIAIGYLIDRFSFRTIVQMGLALICAGVLILQYAHHFAALVIATALFGVGVSPIWIVCLSKVTEESRATQMGLLYTVWLIGFGSGPVIANFLMDLSFTLSFWIFFFMSFLGLAISLRLSKQQIPKVDRLTAQEQFTMLWDRMMQMRLLLPGMILPTIGASMLIPVLPIFASQVLGLSYSQYSLVLLTGGICCALGLIPMGKLTDMWNKKWFLVGGFVLFSIALYSITQSDTFLVCLLWAVVLGFSYASVLPAWNALMAQYIPPAQKGVGWGLFSTIEGLGIMIGPVLGGYLAKWFGSTASIFTSAGIFFCIGLFFFLFPYRSVRVELE